MRHIVYPVILFLMFGVGPTAMMGASYAAEGRHPVTHYELVTGAIFIWCNSSGVWQNGLRPGGSFSFNVQHRIPSDANNVRVYGYNQGSADHSFNFEDTTGLYTKMTSKYNRTEDDYIRYYHRYSASPMVAKLLSYDQQSATVHFNYSGTLNPLSGVAYDVKAKIASGNLQEIKDLMGPSNQQIFNQMVPSHPSFNKNVRGYLYFASIIIAYDRDVYFGHINGKVDHTERWDANRLKYNDQVSDTGKYRDKTVFWTGERFVVSADVGGDVRSVSCVIVGHPEYIAELNHGSDAESRGGGQYKGELWDSSMINLWGLREPQELVFQFTSLYDEGLSVCDEVKVTLDSTEDYWRLHRYF